MGRAIIDILSSRYQLFKFFAELVNKYVLTCSIVIYEINPRDEAVRATMITDDRNGDAWPADVREREGETLRERPSTDGLGKGLGPASSLRISRVAVIPSITGI